MLQKKNEHTVRHVLRGHHICTGNMATKDRWPYIGGSLCYKLPKKDQVALKQRVTALITGAFQDMFSCIM